MLGLRLARLGLLVRLLAPAGALTFFGATSAPAEVGAAGPAPDAATACPSKAEALAAAGNDRNEDISDFVPAA